MSTFATPSIRRDRPDGLTSVGTVTEKTGLVVTEYGFGPHRMTMFDFTAMPMTITNALAYASQKLYTFPTGVIRFKEASSALTLTTTSALASTLNASKTVTFGFGSAAASAATLATTMIDAEPGSGASLGSFTSSATINVASAKVIDWLKHATAQNAASILDGSTTAKDLYFNLAVPTGTDIDGDATVEVNGKFYMEWSIINDGNL